ncbi:MAG: hypothetical protein EXR98_09310 [Gemmataceae bacterium]|nr:hypothetical protein [Gemmataceae bacterium]
MLQFRAAFLFATGLVLCSILAVQLGCQQTQRPVEEARPSQLAIFYGRFISKHQGQSPANEKELKDFIRQEDASVNVDEIFISPRDKEPYVVRYKLGMAMPGAEMVTVHEKTGANGKKMVGLATGQVRMVDDDEFQKLVGRPTGT